MFLELVNTVKMKALIVAEMRQKCQKIGCVEAKKASENIYSIFSIFFFRIAFDLPKALRYVTKKSNFSRWQKNDKIHSRAYSLQHEKLFDLAAITLEL